MLYSIGSRKTKREEKETQCRCYSTSDWRGVGRTQIRRQTKNWRLPIHFFYSMWFHTLPGGREVKTNSPSCSASSSRGRTVVSSPSSSSVVVVISSSIDVVVGTIVVVVGSSVGTAGKRCGFYNT